MKKEQIIVGHTYKNRRAGTTKRTVLAIGDNHKPEHYWNSGNLNPKLDDTGVLFEQKGNNYNLFMSSFSSWCGKDITGEI